MTCSTTRSTNVAMGDLQVRAGWSRGGRRRVRSGGRGGSRLYPAKDGPIRVEGRSSRLRPSKAADVPALAGTRSEEHTSEPSHVAISYAVFCLKKKKTG